MGQRRCPSPPGDAVRHLLGVTLAMTSLHQHWFAQTCVGRSRTEGESLSHPRPSGRCHSNATRPRVPLQRGQPVQSRLVPPMLDPSPMFKAQDDQRASLLTRSTKHLPPRLPSPISHPYQGWLLRFVVNSTKRWSRDEQPASPLTSCSAFSLSSSLPYLRVSLFML